MSPKNSSAPVATEATANHPENRPTMNILAPDQQTAIKVTIYGRAIDNEGRAEECTDWADFCASVRDLVENETASDKRHLPAIGPHTIAPGMTRANDGVTAVTLAALDIDKGLPDIRTLIDALVYYELTAIVHTSPSDPAPESRKVRVYLPVSRPLESRECGIVRRALATLLGVTIDGGTLDPARMFFAGRISGTPAREVWETTGRVLDVDELISLKIVPDEPERPAPAPRATTNPVESDAPLGDAVEAKLDRIAEIVEPFYTVRSGAESGNSHPFSLALAGWVRSKGLPATAARYLVCKKLPTNNPTQKAANVAAAYAMATPPSWEKIVVCMTEQDPDAAPAALAALDAVGLQSEWWERRQATPRARHNGLSVRADDDDTLPNFDPRQAGNEKRSDLGSARRLVRIHGADLRYCAARGVWYVWDGARWCPDDTGEVLRRAKGSADMLWDAVKMAPEERREALAKWAVQSQNAGRIASAIKLAESEPGIPVRVTDLDADPWLLNVQNGTLDLRTGELREPDRALLMTKCCAAEYVAGARSELWEAFVARTTGGDTELAAYIQRALGYALFGAWKEKAFWFGYGPPDGAKSTLLGIVGDVLGDYHVAAAASTWMVQHNVGANRGDVTRLLGARLVTSLEIRPGQRFDEELVKKVTGGDTIVAAAKYEGEIQFPPTFALWMGANDRPAIRDDDEGMWSRMRCVPFTNPVPKAEQDPDLRATLAGPEHAPAVLAWLVAGCLAWQKQGIGTCAAVGAATRSYRSDMNQAAGFFADRCELTGDAADEVPRKRMRQEYESWCRSNGVRHPLSADGLGQRLRSLGCGDDGDRLRPVKVVTAGGNAAANPTAAQTKAAGRDRHWIGVRLRVE
jgi:P4 family phage/plasmid primase-like protien